MSTLPEGFVRFTFCLFGVVFLGGLEALLINLGWHRGPNVRSDRSAEREANPQPKKGKK